MTPDPEDTANLQGTAEKVGYKNPPKSGQFKKGYDPRRNLRGVPTDTVKMRKLMREIASEIIGSGDTEMTRLSAMLRQLWTSRNPAHNKLALQVLDPKILTEQVDVTSGGEKLETPKDDNVRFDRAISTLADALREVIPRTGDKQNSEVDTAK